MKNIFEWFDKKLEFKIFSLVLVILISSFTVIYFLLAGMEKSNLMRNEVQKSKLVADTIHGTLERDMMAMRADVVRGLMGDFKKLEGVLRIQIVRGDAAYVGTGSGREEAFMDYKTLDDVKKRVAVLYRPEWEKDHPNFEVNIADGTENPKFQTYFSSFVESLSDKSFVQKNETKLLNGLFDVNYFENVQGREALTYLRPLPNFTKCALCHGFEHKMRGVLMITTDSTGVIADLNDTKRTLLIAMVVTVFILLILLRFLIRGVVINPVNTVAGALKEIAEGGGDLSQRITVTFRDEIGAVARWFNLFIQKIQHIISEVSVTSRQVKKSSKNILEETKKVVDRANVQLNAIDETSSAVEKMNKSIMKVAENSENLSEMSDESAVAVIEMSSSTDEIARSAAVLSASVEETTSSILEMSSSAKQIDENVSVLNDSAESTMELMDHMNDSIKQMQGNIHETVELSQGVTRDAEKGEKSAEKTIEGISRIQEYSNEIGTVIQNLKNRTENIGTILNVIDEVAEQTNLLALNAAIIAAQAGTHGKSFSVVAQEIKALADRTATSTKEIHDIIKALQQESNNAVDAIRGGARSVEEGVRLSREVGDALNQILKRSQKSTVRNREIARSADEQTGGVKAVNEAMKKVSAMTQQIARATTEQTRVLELIMNGTERMKDISVNVKGATHQQSLGNQRITEISEKVNRRVKEIARSTGSQREEITNILTAVNQIRDVIGQNVDSNGKIGLAVEEMMEKANKLFDEISKFKT